MNNNEIAYEHNDIIFYIITFFPGYLYMNKMIHTDYTYTGLSDPKENRKKICCCQKHKKVVLIYLCNVNS